VSLVADHIVLYDIPWKSYTKMFDALGDKHVRHVYQHGTLEMWSTSAKRERLKCILRMLIDWAAHELRVPRMCVGSATRRDARIEHGTEPDVSYYVGRRSVSQAMRRWRTGEKGTPDLAIDVEPAGAVLAKLDTYVALGVPEVWRHRRGMVEFLVLRDGKYQPIERSSLIPLLTTRLINAGVNHFAEQWNDTASAKWYLARIKKLRKKS
jgi:Uma2 family endonuclease